jgi:hypothetical protein
VGERGALLRFVTRLRSRFSSSFVFPAAEPLASSVAAAAEVVLVVAIEMVDPRRVVEAEADTEMVA